MLSGFSLSIKCIKILSQLKRKTCYMYEVKSEKPAVEGLEPVTPGLRYKCSTTQLRPLDQPLVSALLHHIITLITMNLLI